jgi:hypothetical protein
MFATLLLWLVFLSHASGFVPQTQSPNYSTVAVFGLASDMARRLGQLVGGSEWKQVSDSFREGFEESQINARARNAKPMEALPPELPDSMGSSTPAESTMCTTTASEVVDVEVEPEQQDQEEPSKR